MYLNLFKWQLWGYTVKKILHLTLDPCTAQGVGALMSFGVEHLRIITLGPPCRESPNHQLTLNNMDLNCVGQLKKNLHVSGIEQFKLVLFQGQLYYVVNNAF